MDVVTVRAADPVGARHRLHRWRGIERAAATVGVPSGFVWLISSVVLTVTLLVDRWAADPVRVVFLISSGAFGVCGLGERYARRIQRDAELLSTLELTLTPDGITWSGVEPGSGGWGELRRVELAGPVRRRRLILEDAGGHLVEVPIDALEEPADAVSAAIRRLSGGRYPTITPDAAPMSSEEKGPHR